MCKQGISCWKLAISVDPGSVKAFCSFFSVYIRHDSGFTTCCDSPSSRTVPLIFRQTTEISTDFMLGSPNPGSCAQQDCDRISLFQSHRPWSQPGLPYLIFNHSTFHSSSAGCDMVTEDIVKHLSTRLTWSAWRELTSGELLVYLELKRAQVLRSSVNYH